MLLREHLNKFTKEELLNHARNFEIRKCSGLRKADLIERIVEDFCTEEIMRNRLTCLTKEQMEFFRKACIVPQDVSINEIIDGIQLYKYWIGCFEEITDKFCVFEEIAAVFIKIDDDAFKKEQYKKGWIVKCVQFFHNYYGIAPIEIIYEMYKLKVKCTIDEMINMLYEMPIDIIAACIFSMERLGIQDCPKEDPIYSEIGLFVQILMLEDKEFNYLFDKQKDKEFYIPSAQLIDEIYKFGYEASSQAYKKLELFFMKKLSLSYEKAIAWCVQVWTNCYSGELPAEMINKMVSENIVLDSEKIMNELLALLVTAHNNTRMKENRGHKPNELLKRKFSGGMPTIVPESSHAAAILKDAAPQLQAMGIPLNLDGNADIITTTLFPNGIVGEAVRTEKKIYPNDPCACGSGKKYKKCCGKYQ